ncbi:MAG TPA: glucuronate isomerase [Propionibacteriaceae bacterium]|nr:glucuronate isomerase [Propionibacteriaceae bacterium]
MNRLAETLGWSARLHSVTSVAEPPLGYLTRLATTDDPCDDLVAHQFLASDETRQGRVIPTFRPDKYLEAARPNLECRC